MAQTVDQIVTGINTNGRLTGKVKASNDNGKLRISNLSTADLTVVGANATDVINGGTGAANTQTITGNTVRSNLVTQFNNLIPQLNSIAGNSSFNGINLLNGDALKLVFNETNTSSISIQSQNANGVNATTLGIGAATGAEFSSNTSLNSRLTTLQTALTTLAVAVVGLRLEPVDRAEPPGLHQEHDQHAADRFGQPDPRRHQPGRRQPAGPADPSAALDHGAVAGFAGRPGGAAAPLSLTTYDQKGTAGPLAPPFSF